jgi:hypothetical protein
MGQELDSLMLSSGQFFGVLADINKIERIPKIKKRHLIGSGNNSLG